MWKTREPFVAPAAVRILGAYKEKASFVPVALRAAPILKNRVFFCYLLNFLHIAKLLILLGFEHREYASLISFEKCCRMH